MNVGIYSNPPLVFYENGEAKGLFIDLLEYIAEKEGWELEYTYSTFPILIEKLEKGEIDLLPDVAYSEERSKVLSFSNETVISNWGVICAKSRLDSILDLDGLKIAGVKDDVYYESLKGLVESFGLNCEFIDIVGDYGDVLTAVKEGRADAGVVSRLYADFNAKNFGLSSTSIVFSPVELRFAAPKNRTSLLSKIDKHLSELKKDENSVYYSYIDKWIGQKKKEIPRWVYAVFLILAAISVLAVYREYFIRRELRKREEELIRTYGLLKRISRINELMLREKDVESLARKSVEVLGDYLNAMVVIFSKDGIIAYEGGSRVLKKSQVEKYHCIRNALERRSPVYFSPEKHPRSCPHFKTGFKFHSYVFPATYKGNVKGVLFIQSEYRLSSRETRLLRTLAEDIAFAVHSIEMEEEKDAILNQLDDNINDMMALVDRIRNPLSVIKGYSEIFCESAQEKIDTQVERILDIVRTIEERWKESERLKDRLRRS
ncbi:transporter substrate-binding domain-containing protein [Geoglobus sp.]